MSDRRVIKTYIWHGDRCYFVSTINRESSAMGGGRYAETMVWEFDWKNNERISGVLWQDEAGEDCIHSHIAMVKRIHETGSGERP